MKSRPVLRQSFLAASGLFLMVSEATHAQSTVEPSAIERTIPRAPIEKPADPATLPSLNVAAESATTGESFILGAVHVSGATAFTPAELAAEYEPYLATVVDDVRLKEIAARITARYQAAGYPLSYAMLPRQNVRGGVVRIDVVEGQVGAVVIEGAGRHQSGLDAIAAPLSADRPLRTATLERVLGLLRDQPGFQVADVSVARVEGSPADHVMTIRIVRNAVRGLAYVDNHGTIPDARVRLYTSLGIASLATTGDELRLNAFAIPGDGFRYLYGQAAYAFPIGADGLALELAASQGDQYQRANNIPVDGSSTHLSAQLRYPLVRSRAFSAIAKLGVSDWRSISRHDVTRLQRDRIRVARFGMAITSASARSFSGELWVAQGLDFDAATQPGDPLASRPDAGGKFTKVSFTVQASQQLDPRFTLRAFAAGQLSSAPLLSIEEFALGGSQVGRAFDFNELTGDHGFGGSLEIGFRPGEHFAPFQHVEFFTFIDGGAAFQHGYPAGIARNRALASMGGGARFMLGGIYVNAEAGVPVETTHGENAFRAFVSASKAF